MLKYNGQFVFIIQKMILGYISGERWLPKYETIQWKLYKEIYFNGNISVIDVTQKTTSQTGSDHFNVTSKIIFSNTSENDKKNIIKLVYNYISFEWYCKCNGRDRPYILPKL